MFVAAQLDMPFAETLPKREKSKLAKVWEHFSQVRAVAAEKGMLVPQHLIADLLDLSKQRVGQLVDDGRLEGVNVGGIRYVTENSVVAFAQVERRVGRPPKIPDNKTLWKGSLSSARDTVKNISK